MAMIIAKIIDLVSGYKDDQSNHESHLLTLLLSNLAQNHQLHQILYSPSMRAHAYYESKRACVSLGGLHGSCTFY